MENKHLGLIAIFLVIGSAIYLVLNNSESAIPPTPAIQTIYIYNNGEFPNSTRNYIEADVYDFLSSIGTDGSIKINITEFTP